MGVSGCGKTSVGKALAQRCGSRAAFVDADSLHPAANVAKMAAGSPLDDDDRWPWLDAVRAAMDAVQPNQLLVVACSALKASYRARLGAAGRDVLLVHLAAPFGVILARMQARQGHFMPPALLQTQFDALEVPKEDEPHVSVDVAAVVDILEQALERGA